MQGLKYRKCVPCEGGVPKLGPDEIVPFLSQVSGWEARQDKLHKTYKFKDFRAAMAFVNRVAELAEEQGHHPDLAVHYNRVEMTLWTHAIDGLSENDFIMAAKIDDLA